MKHIALILLVAVTLSVPALAANNVAGCFSRTYDLAHLAKHPDQIVTAVKLHLKTNPNFSLSLT